MDFTRFSMDFTVFSMDFMMFIAFGGSGREEPLGLG